MGRVALITGITGQDGAYLSQLLLNEGYAVLGAQPSHAASDTWRLAQLGIERGIQFVDLDLLNSSGIERIAERYQPDEVYNLGGLSSVQHSFDRPLSIIDTNGLGAVRLLEAIRVHKPRARYCQASSSEIFGAAVDVALDEGSPLRPVNPYGVSKALAHSMTGIYRSSHGIHASNAILFNHESPLRGLEFVTRKVTATLAQMARDIIPGPLVLGNLDARRDWGFAGDYVRGMWLMVQREDAADFVLATGTPHSVREFVAASAAFLGYDLVWEGKAEHEVGRDSATGRLLVAVSPEFYRPVDGYAPVGNAALARQTLGWAPTVSFQELVAMMTSADYDRAANGPIHF